MEKAPAVNEKLASQNDEDEIDLRIYWYIFYKHKWTIIWLTLLIGVLTTLVVFSLQPIYRSEAMLLIESDRNKVISIEEIYGVSPFKKEYYQTQLEIIKSWSLAELLVKKLNLVSHPTLDPTRKPEGFTLNWRNLLPSSWLSAKELPTEEEKINSVIITVMAQLSVAPVRNSQLVKISFESPDAQLAAKVPNTLIDLYIDSDLEARLQMTNKAAEWLTERIEGLRDNLRKSERALQVYMDSKNLINVAGVKTVAARQIEESASKLVDAKQKLAQAESVYDQVQALRGRGSEAFESIPAVLNHSLVQSLKQAELEAERKVSELSEHYGQKHPKIIGARTELNTTKANTTRQIQRVIGGISKEYEVARANVKALERILTENKKKIQALNRKEFRLKILEREVAVNRQLYEMFLTRFKETSATQDVQSLQSTVGRLIDRAMVSSTGPYKPKKKLIVAISLVLGFMFSTMLAFLLEHFDNTIKDGEDIEQKLGLPLLGTLPGIKPEKKNENKPQWMFVNEPKSQFAESVRTIRTGIMLAGLDSPHKVLVVTSSIPGEGKSTVSVNQAFALGQMEKTLLIDADMRRPSIVKTFGLSKKAPGLAELVATKQSFDECIHKYIYHMGEGEENEGGGIDVMPSGKVPENPLDLLSSSRFKELIKKLSEKYGYIVIDSAPTMLVSDSLVLAKIATEVLYIVKADATPYQVVQEGIKRLHRVDAPLENIVLNQVQTKKSSKSHYYGKYGYYKNYYSGYYAEHGNYSKGFKQ